MADYDKNYPTKTPDTFKNILSAGIDFKFVSAHTIFPYRNTGFSTSSTTRA